jgi:hypothetical protein
MEATGYKNTEKHGTARIQRRILTSVANRTFTKQTWQLHNPTFLSRTSICSPHSKSFFVTSSHVLESSIYTPPPPHSTALLVPQVHYPNCFRTTLKNDKAISSETSVGIQYCTRASKDEDWIRETWGRCAWRCVADRLVRRRPDVGFMVRHSRVRTFTAEARQ